VNACYRALVPQAPTTSPSARRARMAGPERRVAILNVARGLFARGGYHGTSTAEIARAAGCSEAVLYRHFASKQALFAAVIARTAGQIKGRLASALAEDEDHPIGGMARGAARVLSDPEIRDHLRLRSIAVTMVDEPEIRSTLEEMHRGFRRLLSDAVRTSQANGHLRRDISPEHAAKLFAGLSFIGAFDFALGGMQELQRVVPATEALLSLLRPLPTPTVTEGDR
jgi:AcrR family transcriptional regulator